MKMLKKEAEQRQAIEMLCTDMLVPQEHLLRWILRTSMSLSRICTAKAAAGQAAILWCCSSWR